MKRMTTKAFLLVIMLMTVFAACKKEDVYNPKKKIQKIDYILEYPDNEEVEPYYQTENWTWQDDKLVRIQNEFSTVDLTYDGDLLSKVVTEGYTLNFNYEKSLLSSVKAVDSDLSFELIVKERKKNKITKMTMITDIELFKKSSSESLPIFDYFGFIFRFLLPEQTPAILMQECMKHQDMIAEAKSEMSINLDFVYDKNNVSEIKMALSFAGFPISLTALFTYDNKNNPYYHSLYHLVGTTIAPMAPLSENNVISYYVTSVPDEKYTYTYTYTGDWPATQRFRRSFMGEETYLLTYTYQ